MDRKLTVQRLKICLRIKRRHTARASTGDGLAVDVIGYVACGKYARDVGGRRAAFGAGLDFDEAARHVELALKNAAVRRVPDGNEQAWCFDLLRAAVFHAFNAHGVHA